MGVIVVVADAEESLSQNPSVSGLFFCLKEYAFHNNHMIMPQTRWFIQIHRVTLSCVWCCQKNSFSLQSNTMSHINCSDYTHLSLTDFVHSALNIWTTSCFISSCLPVEWERGVYSWQVQCQTVLYSQYFEWAGFDRGSCRTYLHLFSDTHTLSRLSKSAALFSVCSATRWLIWVVHLSVIHLILPRAKTVSSHLQ